MNQFELVANIASKGHFSGHAEREARLRYLKVGANSLWVKMCADSKVYHPVSQATRQVKACFVGQLYSDQDRYLTTSRRIKNRIFRTTITTT